MNRVFAACGLLCLLISGIYIAAQAPADSKGKIVYFHQGSLWSKTLPSGTPTELVRGETPQWSSSGEWLSYEMPGSGSDSLVVRDMNPPYTNLNLKTEGEVHWSPAADELAFVGHDGLMKIRPQRQTPHGTAQVLYRPESGSAVISFCWSMDGSRLAVLTGDAQTQALWNIDDTSGHAEAIPMTADVGSAKLAGWTSDNQRVLMWPNPEGSESIAADGLPLIAVSVSSGSAQAFIKDPVLRYPDFVSFTPKRPEILVTSGAYRDSWTNKQLVIANPTTGQWSELTTHKIAVASVTWSPDGELIAYSAGSDGGPGAGGTAAKAAVKQRHLWVMKANGQQSRQLTSDSQYRDEYPTWSKDGQYLVFPRIDTENHISVWGMVVTGGTAVKLVDAIMDGSTRDTFGYYDHVTWEKYLAWSR